MNTDLHNQENVFPPYRKYSHAVEVKGGASLLFISGINGYLQNGIDMPESFKNRLSVSGNILGQYWHRPV